MSVFNKINDDLIVDTFKNVFQRRSSEPEWLVEYKDGADVNRILECHLFAH